MYYRQNPYEWEQYSNYIYGNHFNTYTNPTYYPNQMTNNGMYYPYGNPDHSQLSGLPNIIFPQNMQAPSYPVQPFSPNHIQSNQMQPPMNPFYAYFKDKDGNLDINKMMVTVGQFSNTVKQVSPLFKQFGALLGKV